MCLFIYSLNKMNTLFAELFDLYSFFMCTDDNGLQTFSIAETLYESVIMKECTFDSEVSREIPDQNVKHLDNLSGK